MSTQVRPQGQPVQSRRVGEQPLHVLAEPVGVGEARLPGLGAADRHRPQHVRGLACICAGCGRPRTRPGGPAPLPHDGHAASLCSSARAFYFPYCNFFFFVGFVHASPYRWGNVPWSLCRLIANFFCIHPMMMRTWVRHAKPYDSRSSPRGTESMPIMLCVNPIIFSSSFR